MDPTSARCCFLTGEEGSVLRALRLVTLAGSAGTRRAQWAWGQHPEKVAGKWPREELLESDSPGFKSQSCKV